MRTPLSRRAFLTGLGASAVTLACSSGSESSSTTSSSAPASASTSTALPTATTVAPSAPPTTAPLVGDPFRLGVASGDPTADSVILWTRLLDADGNALDADPIEVTVEVFADDALTERVGELSTEATPAFGHAVHIDATGLAPSTWYWYRFRAGGFDSPVGRARTLPAAGATPEQFRFAFSSCQNFEQGYYAAHRHLADEDAEVMVWLGDYIYEYGPGNGGVRTHDSDEIVTIDDYRARYALYKSDPDLQASHAARPWICTWDDHEVDNDYADATSEQFDDEAAFLDRRAAGYQAWYEHQPVRLPAPDGADWQIHRTVEVGDLLRFYVLDTRQYRSDQPRLPGLDVPSFGVVDVVQPFGEEAQDPDRTMLGADQSAWLATELDSTTAGWNVLAQQVFMFGAQIPLGGDEPLVTVDTWDGYAADRSRVLGLLADGVPNPVVLTGDFHSAAVGDLRVDPFDLDLPVIGTEFMASSISSSFFDGDPTIDLALSVALSSNPQIKYFDSRRGYCVCTVTPERWVTEYRAISDGTDADATVETIATYEVAEGAPGAV